MPFIDQASRLTNIEFCGIGTNLACQCGVAPDRENMGALSSLADSIESKLGTQVKTVSAGNSANVSWALGAEETGRVNALRLGEAILLGRDPLHRNPIDGLYTDAFTLVAEVIERKQKPTKPWGEIRQGAFGPVAARTERGVISQAILSVGQQDVDPDGLEPPDGMTILGGSSDHLVLDTGRFEPAIGAEIRFQLNYSALLRTMTSPFVAHEIIQADPKASLES